MDRIDSVRNGPYAPLFSALGNPPDMRNVPKALALAVNYSADGWEVDTLTLLIDGDFERAAATVEYELKSGDEVGRYCSGTGYQMFPSTKFW